MLTLDHPWPMSRMSDQAIRYSLSVHRCPCPMPAIFQWPACKRDTFPSDTWVHPSNRIFHSSHWCTWTLAFSMLHATQSRKKFISQIINGLRSITYILNDMNIREQFQKTLSSHWSSGDNFCWLSWIHKSNKLSLSMNSIELNLFECSCVACASWFNV